jgi:hypothetical protein
MEESVFFTSQSGGFAGGGAEKPQLGTTQQAHAPEWRTEADKAMLTVDHLQAVPWEHFKECTEALGEMMIGAVEMMRFEECTVAPGPGNDVIVASVLVVWTETIISTMKLVRYGDWPVGHSVEALEMLFHALPVDTVELAEALSYFQRTEDQHTGPLLLISPP